MYDVALLRYEHDCIRERLLVSSLRHVFSEHLSIMDAYATPLKLPTAW